MVRRQSGEPRSPSSPVQAAKKYVAYMGGADAVIKRAREDFKNGEYRFVARSQTSLCLPTRPTRKRAISRPTRTSNSAIWRNPPHGAMHIFMPLLNCVTAPLKLAAAKR